MKSPITKLGLTMKHSSDKTGHRITDRDILKKLLHLLGQMVRNLVWSFHAQC